MLSLISVYENGDENGGRLRESLLVIRSRRRSRQPIPLPLLLIHPRLHAFQIMLHDRLGHRLFVFFVFRPSIPIDGGRPGLTLQRLG